MTLKSKVLNFGFFAFNCLYRGILPIEIFAAPDPDVSETVLIILSLLYKQKNRKVDKKSVFSIPLFIIGFFVLFIMTNYDLIPDLLLPYLKTISKYCLLFAMAAIGLNVSIKMIFQTGYKAVLVSSITFMLQIILVIYILSN